MASLRKVHFKLVAGLAAALVLAACSRTFRMEVTGTVGDGVRFTFYETEDDREPVRLNITEFVVQEQGSDGEWTIVWRLRGGHRLDSIEYGVRHDGLEEIVPPRPLRADARYRALAWDLTWPHPMGHSAIAFSFGQDGVVTAESTPG